MPPKIQTVSAKTSSQKVPLKGGGVWDDVVPLSDLFAEDSGIKIMLYGESGSGKTTLWATFPAPILSVVYSSSQEPGELRSVNTPENRERIFQKIAKSSDDLVTLCADAVKRGFKTVVVDHVTGFQDKVLEEILGRPLPEQKGWGLATQQDYGQCTLQCKAKLRALLDLPINAVIIGQERQNEKPEDSELIQPKAGVATTPSLAGWLNSSVDYIANTFVRPKTRQRTVEVVKGKPTTITEAVLAKDGRTPMVEYGLRVSPNAACMTKFRVPKGANLPPVILDPSYEKIMAVIRGEDPETA